MGYNAVEALRVLGVTIISANEIADIKKTAEDVRSRWIEPLSGGEESVNGLIYGLVQSGKTGVLTLAAAIGADEGYKTILVLTSDIAPLYKQTAARVQNALPQLHTITKADFKDTEKFVDRVKQHQCVIVTSKNVNHLNSLIENFKKGRLRGLPTLIIDDEADQASLDGRANKPEHDPTTINRLISDLRKFFGKNTYLQVTATPQALFLQPKGHEFRPKFTILSRPGGDYVGGEDFFGEDSDLVREFDISHLSALWGGHQPLPNFDPPSSLVEALDHFMIGATYKRLGDPSQNCAFLCHISMRKSDHAVAVGMLRRYQVELESKLKAKNATVLVRLRACYDLLCRTHPDLKKRDFEEIVDVIGRFAPGIVIKLVNGKTDEDVSVDAPYNLFVGGNKLGRGVTIKNLLVSYYGRHPKQAQADTVLQHARMYGYRRKDLGLLRLFLPGELHLVFKAIYKMETTLRELIAKNPGEEFRGIYIEEGLKPTRKNVIPVGSLGIYSAGSNYNPSDILRDSSSIDGTQKIDVLLKGIENKGSKEFNLEFLAQIIELTQPDMRSSELVWDAKAMAGSLRQFASASKKTNGWIYVDRDRGLKGPRVETKGIIEGGEKDEVPQDQVALFMIRMKGRGDQNPAWWPQVRFPDGRYAFAFSV